MNHKTNKQCAFKGKICCDETGNFHCKRHVSKATSSCSICFEYYGKKKTDTLTCNHCFHRKCLNQWIEHGGDTCPICRARMIDEPIDTDFIYSIPLEDETLDYEEIEMFNMTNEEAYNSLALFFIEGYSIPQQVYERAITTFDWSSDNRVSIQII